MLRVSDEVFAATFDLQIPFVILKVGLSLSLCVSVSVSLSRPVCIFGEEFVTLERILSTLCGFSGSDRRKILLDTVSEKVVQGYLCGKYIFAFLKETTHVRNPKHTGSHTIVWTH